jgi:DNA mismatch repair protein MutL
MSIIRLLPDSIANQIAAGEVVQRPASVVKELMENALDAGGTSILLNIEEGGRALIEVRDNGTGMSVTDARMCFERHATSKLRSAQDLYALTTMGFRGEAMASIAAVAQVHMHTCLHDAELGTEIVIEGSQVKVSGPTACAAGTRIQVRNLFFNTPARRQFLKSTTAELRHIVEEFTRLALARPDVAMHLHRDGEEYLRLAAGKLAQRIPALLGKGYEGQLVPCQEHGPGITITGYVGRPELARKTRGEQYFFVNQRYVKHGLLHYSIAQAYEGLLAHGSHPFYCLYIELDPARIDVNVHPTKTEVKFDDERAIYALLFAAVRRALSQFHVVPPLDFDGSVNFALGKEHLPPLPGSAELTHTADAPFPASTSIPPTGNYSFPQASRHHFMTGFEIANEGSVPTGTDSGKTPTIDPTAADGSTYGYQFTARSTPAESSPGLPGMEYESHDSMSGGPHAHLGSSNSVAGCVFPFGSGYMACAMRSGLLIVDIAAALERIYFEAYSRRSLEGGFSQQSIFPVTWHLPPADWALEAELMPELAALGFTLEPLGHGAMLVAGTPPEVPIGHELAILEGLTEHYKQQRNQLALKLPRREIVARGLATKAARLAAGTLSQAELSALVSRLFTCQNPSLTPDGRPTTLMLEQQTLASWMGKAG